VSALRPFGEGLWIAEAPLRFFGVPFGTRMTVVRLEGGDLLLHSPVALSPPLRAEVQALGPVRHVVSPNKLHHLYLAPAREAFPEARFHAPPGLRRKRPDLAFDADLGDAAPPPWPAGLDLLVIRGSRIMEEVVFLHRPTRTLLVGDLCEHFGRDSPPLTRLVARIARMYERPCMPPDWRLSFRDREATRASFTRLLAWDFERVILAHGRLIGAGAHAIFEREYVWALA
jgi:hypothetical protein